MKHHAVPSNINRENNENPSNSEMSSIQTELEELETQLGNNNNARRIGQSVFRSINSALGSIRSRMERATEDAGASPTSLVPSSSYTDRLMERLSRAELAHSARIPLDRLQSELNRRQAAASAGPSTTDNTTQRNAKRDFIMDR